MLYLAQKLDMGGPVEANVTWIVCFPGKFFTITEGEKGGYVPGEVKVFCW